MGQHLTSQGAHPTPALLGCLVERGLDGVLDALRIMRVGQVGLTQFGCRTGEFAEHQGTAEIAATGDILLGDQVHAVAQRGDQHDVAGDEEGDQFVAGDRTVQVMHHRVTDLAVLAVDMADLLLDVIAQGSVTVHSFPARCRQLHQYRVRTPGPAFGEQLRERFEANLDALGVVESVYPEQYFTWVAQLCADLLGALTDCPLASFAVEFGGVDRDGECADLDFAGSEIDLAEAGPHPDRGA